jgi:hypothetical protein
MMEVNGGGDGENVYNEYENEGFAVCLTEHVSGVLVVMTATEEGWNVRTTGAPAILLGTGVAGRRYDLFYRAWSAG